MERAAGEDEIAENKNAAIASKKRKTKRKRKRPAATDGSSSATAVGASVDILGAILARLPARTAIACTALSKHHRSLIRGPEFRSLHCRLGAPPLPRRHVAYLATAPIRRRPEQAGPASVYYGFHLAGPAGLSAGNGNGDSPIRSVAGWRYLGTEYINSCNGVVLIASKGFSDPCRCTFWNPAVADAPTEATVPGPPSSEKEASVPIVLPGEKKNSRSKTELQDKRTQFLALGLGYGQRSRTYKMLVCRKDRSQIHRFVPGNDGIGFSKQPYHFVYSLVVHSLGVSGMADEEDTLPLRTVFAMETMVSTKEEVDQEIIRKRSSLYMDGKIYLLYLKNSVILAFDVDNETVHTIDIPSEHPQDDFLRLQPTYGLIEICGPGLCLAITKTDGIALWKLKPDYHLEPIHVISYKIDRYWYPSIVGAWDCSGVLVLWLDYYEILLYDVAANKMYRGDLPGDLRVEKSDYMLCWGYKPTLVSPESIIGELSEDTDQQRGRSAHITEVIDPLILRDRRKGQKATMNTVCLMKFLVRIMQKLPDDMRDVLEMPSIDSKESALVSPGSITRELNHHVERLQNRSAHMTKVINPLILQDRRKGQEATQDTICLMEFLNCIMQKLPHDMQDVEEMQKTVLDGLGSLFQSVV